MFALTLPFLVGCSRSSSGDDGASVVSAPQPVAVPDDATGPPGSAVPDDGAAQVDPATGGSVNGPVDATALEQTVVAFASCVGDRTVIRIRFRSDPYVGLSVTVAKVVPARQAGARRRRRRRLWAAQMKPSTTSGQRS